MTSSKINKHVLRYIEMVENGEVEACKEQHLLVAYVRRCFETQDIYTDDEQLEDYLSLARYFPYERLFEWEVFCLALHDCTYWTKDDMPRWPDLSIGSMCGAILSIVGVGALVINWQKHQQKAWRFMMKMLFEIIDIMDGKKINGQVKELRREAEQFNIDN